MTKHSPFPWHVHKLDCRMIIDANGFVVADLRSPLSEHCREDGNLIAAAPDLLKALQECRRVILMEHVLYPEYGWLDFVEEKIRPALDKAEGKEAADD